MQHHSRLHSKCKQKTHEPFHEMSKSFDWDELHYAERQRASGHSIEERLHRTREKRIDGI